MSEESVTWECQGCFTNSEQTICRIKSTHNAKPGCCPSSGFGCNWEQVAALDGDKELVEALEAIHEAIQSRAEDTVWFSETMTVCEFIEHTIAEQKEQS